MTTELTSHNTPPAGKKMARDISSFALGNATELCRSVEKLCVAVVATNGVGKDEEVTKWNDAYASDHICQECEIGSIVKLVSWNVLAPKALKWMKKRLDESGVDVSQRLSTYSFSNPANTESRMDIQARLIYERIMAGYLVCLQECSKMLLDAILNKFSQPPMEGMNMLPVASIVYPQYVRSDALLESKKESFNLVIWNGNDYMIGDTTYLFSRDAGIEGSNLPCYTFTNNKTYKTFTIVNVHVRFGHNAAYAAMFKEQMPTYGVQIICGDFNCSSRYPIRDNRTEHILQYYASRDFKFVFPTLGYSHVNTFENTRNSQDMYDKFDYIILKNYESYY